MTTDNDVRQAKLKVDEMESKLSKAKDEVLHMERELRSAQLNLDDTERSFRRDQERAAAEKRREEEQRRLKEERDRHNARRTL